MTYIVDTHTYIWFLDKNKILKPRHHQIFIDKGNNLVFPALLLQRLSTSFESSVSM